MNNLPESPFGMGFIYFNNSPNASESTGNNEYLEFSNTDSPKGSFAPSNSSSPKHPNQFRQRNFRGRRNQKYNRYHNNSDTDNMSCSHYNNKHRNSNYRHKHSKSKHHTNSFDVSHYYHPSMVEDPWKELENYLKSLSEEDNNEQNLSDKDENSDSSTHENDFV